MEESNVYDNVMPGATTNPLIQTPDAIDEAFAQGSNKVLKAAAETARAIIGAHQSAIAIVVQQDWSSVRKYFSLSDKYAAWAEYKTAATGYGTHGWLLRENKPIRLTQAELEAHPEWKNFGLEAGKHPPMRGWLAVPLVDSKGINWGLFQLSDKYDGDFTADDQMKLLQLTEIVAVALETLWDVRNLRKQVAVQG